MLKKILVVLAMLWAAAAFAAVDVNKATAAELDSIKGIGPSISGKIIDERKKGNFKDWPDLIERVKGVGEGNAAKFSAEGLTVNGASFKGVAATTKKDDKAAAKDEKKDTKTAAKDEKKDAKADASKPAASAKADASKPAATAKAEAPKPAASAKADASKPAASAKK